MPIVRTEKTEGPVRVAVVFEADGKIRPACSPPQRRAPGSRSGSLRSAQHGRREKDLPESSCSG